MLCSLLNFLLSLQTKKINHAKAVLFGMANVGLACTLLFSDCSYAFDSSHFRIGMQVGGANVNWGNLIGDYNTAHVTTSNPVSAGGSGVEYGAFAGVQFGQYFALQTNFDHYPTTQITFHHSVKPIDDLHDGIDNSYSNINAWSLDDIFMVPMWKKNNHALIGYAFSGIALMFRRDAWINKTNVGGHFGCGIRYKFTQRYSSQINFDYYTGNGKATEHPIDSYFPFLYSINFGLATRL